MTIWLADDDLLYAPALKCLLEAEIFGSVARWFKTGDELDSEMKLSPLPNFAIVDMMLPWDENDTRGGLPPEKGSVANGIEIAKRLIDKGMPEQSIAIITALGQPRSLEPLRQIGIPQENILFKPAPTSEIVSLARRLARRRP